MVSTVSHGWAAVSGLADVLPQARVAAVDGRSTRTSLARRALGTELPAVAGEGGTFALCVLVVTLSRILGQEALRVAVRASDAWRTIEASVGRDQNVLSLQRNIAAGLAAAASEAAPVDAEIGWYLDAELPASWPSGVLVCGALGRDGTLGMSVDEHVLAPVCAEIVAGAFERTWNQLRDAGASPIGALPALAADELRRLSDHERRIGRPSTPEQTIIQCIERWAAQRPDALAVTCDGRSISYRELNDGANRLARRLRASGIRPGMLVAVAMERSTDLVVALLAVLKSGGAYLPIDLSYPADRVEFTLSDAGASVVLTDAASAGRLPASKAEIIVVDRAADAARDAEAENLPSLHRSESLAYVIYTSGSTGRPKGCQVTHANLMRLLTSTEHWFGFDENDVWTFFHSHAFDFSVWEIWGGLVYGGRVVVVSFLASRSPTAFLDLLIAERVTVLNQTPSAFRTLILADQERPQSVEELSLRFVIFGGEALELQMLRPWFRKHGDRKPRLVNMYGITETTVHVTYRPIGMADVEAGTGSVIGEPIPDLCIFLFNALREPVPVGVTGEIFVGGAGVSLGYLNRPELNAERFVDWVDPQGRSLRLYRSGDLARWLPDGDIEYLGRSDHQVKIRGFRIETGEIESALALHPGVKACAVIPREDPSRGTELVAYVVPSGEAWSSAELRQHLAAGLPEYMVPALWVRVADLPLTANGKLDRRALPAPSRERPEGLPHTYVRPAEGLESDVAEAFARVLGIEQVGALDNFFDLGGNSLLVMKVIAILRDAGHARVDVPTLFADPSARGVAARVHPQAVDDAAAKRAAAARSGDGMREPIAIVGMAGRFPGAADIEALWQMLDEGRDGIRRFSPEELDASIPAALRNDPDYVAARGVVDDADKFDAAFFGIPRNEAELMDPQHRLFLETAWECLERAGHVPEKFAGRIGVFAGKYSSSYYQRHVLAHPDKLERVGDLQVMLANEEFVAMRTAHKLNLTGPAITLHTACSTSLVAIAQAFDALQAGRCEMALAGGASVTSPPASGYLYQEGAMLSRDGHTRSFDADAQGTTFSDGVAVVLLKRLSDALADGNTIHAVIRGVAVNNDGAVKASFTAPSVEGQAAVVEEALRSAGVDARSVSYVEAHGTATPLGDPVEVAALTQAYRHFTADTSFCSLGSVKSNIGHLTIAAGATGVIKTALALANERIPATAHFTTPNPKIDFEHSPFVVRGCTQAWPRGAQPRRAGVSSFGVGGTNAHAILEEAPRLPAPDTVPGPFLLRLSARTPVALESAVSRLANWLEGAGQAADLSAVEFTLREGRRDFAQRTFVVASSATEAAAALRESAASRIRAVAPSAPDMVLMFPGQGSQYSGMGRELYARSPIAREAFDECFAALEADAAQRLRDAMFGDDAARLAQTAVTQPALFCLEYAVAKLWLGEGLRPAALVGHSVGEYVAAALAGVMSVADALRLVARRGELMQSMPAGSMLSVRVAAGELEGLLPSGVQLAAENGPAACVVAGPGSAIEAFAEQLAQRNMVSQRLQTSHAFHSAMMEPAAAEFEHAVRAVALSAPAIPIISTATGLRLSEAQARDPSYWSAHLRKPVRFSPAVRTLQAEMPGAVFVEAGPRGSLSTLVRQHRQGTSIPMAVPSLADQPQRELAALREAEGQLWSMGLEPKTAAAWHSHARRVVLPTYPFERQRFWVDALAAAAPSSVLPASAQPQAADSFNSEVPMSTPVSSANATQQSGRRPALVQRLRGVFEDVSGLDLAESAASDSFVELGLDSLTLTQVAMRLKKEFALGITFRQLMETYRSFDALAEHLDQVLPAEAPSAVPAAAPQAAVTAAPAMAAAAPAMQATQAVLMPAALPVAAASQAGSLVQQVIQQQMLLMSQQLSLLQGQPMPAQMIPAAAAVPVPAMATPAVPAPAAQAAPAAPVAPASAEDDATLAHRTYDVKKAFGAIARIHSGGTELTERQRARLDAFMRRYVEKTRKSKDYTVEHRPHLADPRVINGFRPQLKEIVYQIVVERSKGARMWDLDGNEYVDALSGFGMSMFGWQPDFVLDAVRKQIDSGYDIGPQHPLAGEVAKLMCELTGFDRAGLCNTGSEAVMGCVRIARTVTGRSKIVMFTGSYHGIFDEVLARGTKRKTAVPAAPGILSNAVENIAVLDYGTPETLQWLKDNAEDLAAILVEPVQSRRPDFQPREFLRELRTLTEKSGALLIFDEVVTGFRAHPGGTQALFGIKADLASYGKVVGGGFPIGVIAGKREYMDALDGGHWEYGDDSVPTVGVTYFAGTFVRHPLALVAAKAVLEHLKREGPELQAGLTRRTAAMVDELNAFCREVGAPIVLKSFASVWKIFFEEDHPLQDLLFPMMRNRECHILDNFPCFMTTAHTAQDIAVIKTAFKEAVAELQEADFLPRRVSAPALELDASRPPVPGARLGRDPDGRPAWYVANPAMPGKYIKVDGQ